MNTINISLLITDTGSHLSARALDTVQMWHSTMTCLFSATHTRRINTPALPKEQRQKLTAGLVSF